MKIIALHRQIQTIPADALILTLSKGEALAAGPLAASDSCRRARRRACGSRREHQSRPDQPAGQCDDPAGSGRGSTRLRARSRPLLHRSG